MDSVPRELEVKFYVRSLEGVTRKLVDMGAQLHQKRVQELNLRFDTPERSLSQAGQALRLRYDTLARLTFKGPSQSDQEVRSRVEIEFIASDFGLAKAFLEALGYEVFVIYEKYRTTFEYQGVHITLDELPYGNFVEIEGADPQLIFKVNQQIGLDWNTRIPESYTVLFDILRQRLSLDFDDLTFENFKDVQFSSDDLGVHFADGMM